MNKSDVPAGLGMLLTFGRIGYKMYAGTADPAKVAVRRAKNKVARKSRQVNRRG